MNASKRDAGIGTLPCGTVHPGCPAFFCVGETGELVPRKRPGHATGMCAGSVVEWRQYKDRSVLTVIPPIRQSQASGDKLKPPLFLPICFFIIVGVLNPEVSSEQSHDDIHFSRKASSDAKRQSHDSPDGQLRAAVIGAGKKGSESRVEIRTASGKLIAQASYVSSDGEHGKSVVKADWTPDSRFFVWSMENTGGHSPWHWPTSYFSRKRNRVLSLDDAVGAITDPQFTLRPPDVIQTRRKCGADIKGVSVTVSLGALRPAKRSKVAGTR
jgi:hypothetical protein